MEVSGQLQATAALPPGPLTRSGRGGEEKNSQPLPELEPPIIQPATQRYTAELSRLRYNIKAEHTNNKSAIQHNTKTAKHS
jgi:hypothetical protein